VVGGKKLQGSHTHSHDSTHDIGNNEDEELGMMMKELSLPFPLRQSPPSQKFRDQL